MYTAMILAQMTEDAIRDMLIAYAHALSQANVEATRRTNLRLQYTAGIKELQQRGIAIKG